MGGGGLSMRVLKMGKSARRARGERESRGACVQRHGKLLAS